MKVNFSELKKVIACSLDSKLFTKAKICQKENKLVLERYDGLVDLRAELNVEGDFGTDKVIEFDWLEFLKICSLSYEFVEMSYKDKKVIFKFNEDFVIELPEISVSDSLKKVDLGDVVREVELTDRVLKLIDISKGIIDASVIVPVEFHNVKLVGMDKRINFACSNVVSVYVSGKNLEKDAGVDINSEVLKVIRSMLNIGTVKLYCMNTNIGYCETENKFLTVKIFFSLPVKKLPDIFAYIDKEFSKELKGVAVVNIDEFKKSLLEMYLLMPNMFGGVKFEFKKGVLEMSCIHSVSVRRKIKNVKIEKEFVSILDIRLFKDFIEESNSDVTISSFMNSNIVFIEGDVGLIGVAECQKV